MMRKNNKIGFAFTMLAIAGLAVQANARPNINSAPKKTSTGGQLKTTAASCRPAEASIDLDINNVRAKLMTGGDMWWDIGTAEARYEVPKNSKKNSLFAGSVWIGGYDQQGQLKVAAQTYRQDGNDYWPGPLDASASVTDADCSQWDRFWKVNRADINRFREIADKSSANDPAFDVIKQWPAKGNEDAVGRSGESLNLDNNPNEYAPFVDVAGPNNGSADGLYQWESGDYPLITGDQYIWWVFNDKGNVKQQSQTEGIGIEVQASAFAFSSKDFLNDATFYNYRLINRSNLRLDSTYIATWTDADLGYYLDDYIGCDTNRGLGILYNGKSQDGDGSTNSYGTRIPMVGIDFFKGPKRPVDSGGGKIGYQELKMESFTYYNNDNSVIGNPNNGAQIYNYMTGSIRNGQRFSNDFSGPVVSRAYGAGFPTTRFVFFGDPDKPEWSECYCQNPPADRRFVHSSGPFVLEPGVVNDITIGAVWVSDAGGCPTTSFKKIRVADDLAQGLFDNNFQTIEGPEAPRMEVRELDRKLVFYLVNDAASNNFRERYGRDTAAKYRVSSVKAAKYVRTADSLYKFEGYRVFQLKNSLVQPAQIFNDRGELNTDLAAEVFQCDIKNGITRIINYEKNTDVSDSTYVPIIKVIGADSGLSHSFQLTLDQFATGSEKRFVNYRSYYFVAVAYAYNNFAEFNPKKADSTQDIAYIESSHGASGTPIKVVTAMPNPANGDMGTVLNSAYGDGIIIKRIEGTGNGHNNLQLSDESEKEALFGMNAYDSAGTTAVFVHQSVQPTYQAGNGPLSIKVIDPVKVPAANWELYIMGDNQPNAENGIDSFGSWKLVNVDNGDVIYTENNLGMVGYNEQIIEKYGLSVNIQQYNRPGTDQAGTNGYITSDIIFADPAKPWLAGVNDGESRELTNWIRSGAKTDTYSRCDFNDRIGVGYDTVQRFESLLPKYATTRATWAPYTLAAETADDDRGQCGFGVAKKGTIIGLYPVHSVDVVLTSDKSKWTRCVVLEMQESKDLSANGTAKFDLRSHSSWNMEYDGNGRPVYSATQGDTGMSWFPGYAINQETGERLNIAFGEDSWQKSFGGADMIWNPSSQVLSNYGEVLFGAKHYIYVMNSRYDSCRTFINSYLQPSVLAKNAAYKSFMWVGVPLLNPGYQYKSLAEGLVPTDVRIKLRVDRPYAQYLNPFKLNASDVIRNNKKPLYAFNTSGVAATPVKDVLSTDRQKILDNINIVPNPYYGASGYENNRLDSRVRIINLPPRAVVNIYSVDGTLIRRLEKDNPNVSYLDWDIRNTKGLQIAGGMYLIHVEANGIGETVLKWFGAMRPLDIITY
jgi:hypothetical protein